MNKLVSSLLMVGALSVGIGLAAPNEAAACGGCFHIQQGGDVGQVTGHRMIFSVSQEQTTLWDQISYSGAPESFAWVLPIHGQVTIGVSSDALFDVVNKMTDLKVFSPDISCPQCPGNGGELGTTTTSTGTGGVTVIAEETVGPYETVQLSSQDPAALQNWLSSHGYVIPADVQPIINAYVTEGFDFLAIKLVPGQGVDSMAPIRVTSPGAGLTLPLRMVAAGTGVTTPITLWIAGEGRYQPTNFPNFEITADELTWDWDTMSSDYSAVKAQKFAASQGKGWLLETSTEIYKQEISDPIFLAISEDPQASGYGADAATAQQNAANDMAALATIMPENQKLRLTRIHAELSKPALAKDLHLGASADQSMVFPWMFLANTKGTPPMCPPIGDCGNGGGTTTGTDTFTTGFGGSGGSDTGKGASNEASATGGGCSVGGQGGGFAALMALLGLSAVLGRRRRS